MSKSDFGFGVLIGMTSGNKETVDAFNSCIGKEITEIDFNDSRLILNFGEVQLQISDEGQDCCETRYMHTDDDLQSFVGTRLISGEILDAPNVDHEYDVHEQQFLHIKTNEGVFTIETHNIHNGCYGGFWICASILPTKH
jgi:hypothetical protein